MLLLANGLNKRHVDNFIVANADHHVALSLYKGFDGSNTDTASQNTIACRGTSAALKVTED